MWTGEILGGVDPVPLAGEKGGVVSEQRAQRLRRFEHTELSHPKLMILSILSELHGCDLGS